MDVTLPYLTNQDVRYIYKCLVYIYSFTAANIHTQIHMYVNMLNFIHIYILPAIWLQGPGDRQPLIWHRITYSFLQLSHSLPALPDPQPSIHAHIFIDYQIRIRHINVCIYALFTYKTYITCIDIQYMK
jgi:hypothetical protein